MTRLALAFLLLALVPANLLFCAVPARAETVLNRGNGAEPESLDPAFAGSTKIKYAKPVVTKGASSSDDSK